MIAWLNHYWNPFEEDHLWEVGSCGEGIHCKGCICADQDEGKVFDVKVSEKGECEGFLERVEVEERGACTGGSEDQQWGLPLYHHLLTPDALSNFASMQISWTLQQTQLLMDASTLMTMLLQEVEHQILRAQKHKQFAGKSKEDEKSEVLVVSVDKSRGKGDMSNITCWNCGETGHFSLKCPKPKKSNDGKSTKNSNSKKEELYDSGCTNHISPYQTKVSLLAISMLKTSKLSAPLVKEQPIYSQRFH